MDYPKASREEWQKALGDSLRRHRLEWGGSQVDLAFVCDVGAGTISNAEIGKNPINVMTLFRLCEAMEVWPSDVLQMAEDLILRNEEE